MQFIITDDDSDDIALFDEALKAIQPSAGLIAAQTGEELFVSLETCRPSAIFLDISMPGMNGWDCLVSLKSDAALKNIPVIIYTTSCSKKDIETAMQLGVFIFVTKPVRFLELQRTLLNVIDEIKASPARLYAVP